MDVNRLPVWQAKEVVTLYRWTPEYDPPPPTTTTSSTTPPTPIVNLLRLTQ